MSIVINLDDTTLNLLRDRASLLDKIQRTRNPSGAPHPRGEEFEALTMTIQMRLGNLAFDQAIAEAAK